MHHFRNTAINIGHVGMLIPRYQFGNLVVINYTDAAFIGAGNMDETHIVMSEVIDDIQAAA